MTSHKIYIIGSLRNPLVPEVARHLREALVSQYEIFDDWFAAGPEADDWWREYELARGRTYQEALRGAAASHVYGFDRFHLDTSAAAVLVLPTGRSGHLELGWALGQGKKGFVLLEQPSKAPVDANPPAQAERWDVMYQFATRVVETRDELTAALKKHLPL